MIARLVAIAAALALTACETPAPNADESSCAVYRSFAAALPELPPGYLQVVRDTTSNRLIDADGGATAAPTTFQASDFFADNDSAQRITHDTLAYFEQVRMLPQTRTDACFNSGDIRPVNASFVPGDQTVVWQLSPVAFAPDAQHALIVARVDCYEGCEATAFYLFQRAAHGYILIGSRHLYEVHN